MKEIEDILKSRKKQLDKLEVPDEMEERLRAALNRKKSRIPKESIAVIVLVLIIFSYSFDALAYYGKKILGYDEITYGSIQRLNEEGWGERIGKSCIFSNGVEVTLDGIMFDDNELAAFYKLQGNGNELGHQSPMFRLYGIKPMGYFQRSGHGQSVDNYTQVWIQTFEPPAFYEKWMKLSVQLIVNGRMEEKEIRFTLNRNAAMKRTVKQGVNEKVKTGQYDIDFNSLSASAMSTVIKGRVIPLTEDAAKVFRAEDAIKGMEAPRLRFDAVADGNVVSSSYAAMGVSGNEISFSAQFDALPEKFKTLELRNIRLETQKLVDKSVSISSNTKNMTVAEDLVISKVESDGDYTAVTILSRGIPVMGLFVNGTQINGEDDSAYDYEPESAEPAERVFKFKGGGDNMKLAVKMIKYSVFSDEIVNIPVK